MSAQTQQKSTPLALCLGHLKFISNSFVDEDCAEN